jgi:uncharacterized protein YceH (UPF0502 family)
MNNEDTKSEKPFFTDYEARVIACLMEKQLTTPNNYPLTQNSLMLACNQKSNREPVMNLSEGEVGHTVNLLEARKLVGVDYGGRANHITHRVMNEFGLDRKKQAILCMLMLRAPLTLNDIKARTARMVEFESINEIQTVLAEMMQSEPQLANKIPKGNGSREDRYSHLLCGEIDLSSVNQTSTKLESKSSVIADLEQRIESLEAKVELLMELLDT